MTSLYIYKTPLLLFFSSVPECDSHKKLNSHFIIVPNFWSENDMIHNRLFRNIKSNLKEWKCNALENIGMMILLVCRQFQMRGSGHNWKVKKVANEKAHT